MAYLYKAGCNQVEAGAMTTSTQGSQTPRPPGAILVSPMDAASAAARAGTGWRSGLSLLLRRDSSAAGLNAESAAGDMEPLPDEAVFRRSSLDSWDDLQLLPPSSFSPRRGWAGADATANAYAGRIMQRNCAQCGFLFIDASGAETWPKFCSPVCFKLYFSGCL